MLEVRSTAFQSGEQLPAKYTCDGYGVQPPLAWGDVPPETQSVAILVDDPDAGEQPFLHWLATDIPPELHELEEGGTLPHESNVSESSAGNRSYFGPCPTHGEHHYRFHVYALDTRLGQAPENRDAFLKAIEGHIVDEGEIVATYKRMAEA